MLYHVSRNGQNYGPYTLEDLQKYVASGNVLPTDLAKSDEMPDWVPVSQVLGVATPPAGPAPMAPFGAPPPDYPQTAGLYPDPPNLHWALVLLIGVFTCGIFFTVWAFVEAAWVRKINPRSNGILFFIGCIVVSYGGGIARFSLMMASGMQNQYLGVGALVWLVSVVFALLAVFDMRSCMEEHFNGPEPIGLSLSGVMTFFFGIFYFQYHFSRINELKRMARYRGTAI